MRYSLSCLKVGEAQEERAQCTKKKSHIMNYQALEKEKEKSTRNSSSYLSNYRKFLHLILVRQCPELLNNQSLVQSAGGGGAKNKYWKLR